MEVPQDQILAVLGQFNPWWRGAPIPDLPSWQRAVFPELVRWVMNPPAPRAILVSGARQVGKTTLLFQVARRLLDSGVPAGNIFYATFDHPIIRLAGVERVLEAWRVRETEQSGPEYLLLDEVQLIPDWATWVKHQVDFHKRRRIVLTGSAMPLVELEQESGVGRWHKIPVTTLSFFEYLQIRRLSLTPLPPVSSLASLLEWPAKSFLDTAELAREYTGHFHEYLLRGGFPQTAQIDSLTQAQKLLREDTVDKVLKRDMTAFYGVRRVLELEHLFLYLCLHDGGLLNLAEVAQELSIKRPTVDNFLRLLEAAHLIYRLLPFGYGKEILRARQRVYLADSAIAPAVMLKGKEALDDPQILSVATESSVFKHLYARLYSQNVRITYWRGKGDLEVDLVAELAGQTVPFEVKYRAKDTGARYLRGLLNFCQERKVKRGYVVTRDVHDLGLLAGLQQADLKIMKIPAPLLCYWMGQAEVQESSV